MTNRIAAACGVALLLLGATACGTKDEGASPTSTSPTGSSTSGPRTTQQGQFPGANGKIAAVDGSTAQVQSQQSGQVAVTWTSSTTFTQEVAATLSDVEVGDCVVALPDPDSAGSSDSSAETQVTAATVRITATSGDCAGIGGPGGPGGGQRPDFNGTPPSGAPTGFPSDGPGGGRLRGAFGASGKVTAVSSTGFTVDAVRPGVGGAGSSDDTTTTPVTVTVGTSTTYTTNAKASAADVKVGRCMLAQGTADDTGAVSATTVALSTAVDGECGGGFFRSRDGGQTS